MKGDVQWTVVAAVSVLIVLATILSLLVEFDVPGRTDEMIAGCRDTDGGINYDLAGYVSDSRGNEGRDVCDPVTNELTEYYCSEGAVTSVAYLCPGSCLTDRCA